MPPGVGPAPPALVDGVISASVVPFVLALPIGRGTRFFLIASLIRWGGESARNLLRDCIDRVGWVLLLLAVVVHMVAQID